VTQEINILCLGEGLINCFDMLSARDLKTCREVSQVFRRAVEDTNQRRLAECRDNSPLCSELLMRMSNHYIQEFHIDISPTALYWHTFHWMQTFVKRDNVIFNNNAHDLAIENASRNSSLMALCSIASVQQTENEQLLVKWLNKYLVKGNFASILDQVGQQTTSLDIVRLLMQCADANTISLHVVRTVLMKVVETRNRPCLLEILKFNGLKPLLINNKPLFELACMVGCRELIDLSPQSIDVNFECGRGLRCLAGQMIMPLEDRIARLDDEMLQRFNFTLGGHLDSLWALINSNCFQRASLKDIATSFVQSLVLKHSTCASMIFATNRFLSVPKNMYLGGLLKSVRVSNLFTALRVTGQINHLSSDHLQLIHELATHFNIPDAGIAVAAPSQPLMAEVAALPPNEDVVAIEPEIEEPVTERIPHRSICTPTVIVAASICAILSIEIALLSSLK
jgi:hypothetical protein